jgi:hypothetical protein
LKPRSYHAGSDGVRVLYTVSADGRHLVADIEDVQPSDLPSLTEYEEGEEQRRSRPFWRGGRRRRPNEPEE